MPSMPSHWSCVAGNAPSPISVQVTGKRPATASSVSSSEALPFTTPPPTYRIGRRAFASALAAMRICFALPSAKFL
jgi:hypothetical protein